MKGLRNQDSTVSTCILWAYSHLGTWMLNHMVILGI